VVTIRSHPECADEAQWVRSGPWAYVRSKCVAKPLRLVVRRTRLLHERSYPLEEEASDRPGVSPRRLMQVTSPSDSQATDATRAGGGSVTIRSRPSQSSNSARGTVTRSMKTWRS
jgi:hypothetical protein